MEFLLLGYDGSDPETPKRRAELRPAHLDVIGKMKEDGKVIYGSPIFNDDGQMIGSAIIVKVESRDEIDKWLENEPFVTGKVWEKIEIKRLRS